MHKKITLVLFLTLISLSIFGQEKIKGNKNVTTIITEVNSFNKIAFGENFKVVLTKADNASVEVETDENLHGVIKFSVTDSILQFRTTKKIRSKKRLNITVYYTSTLQEIEINEDAQIKALQTIDAPEMIVKINDYAKADLSIISKNFKLINNNKSRIQLRAKSKLNIESPMIDLALSGSSNTDATIRTDSLKVSMKERASIKVEGFANFMETSAIESTDFTGKNFNVKESILVTKDNSEFSVQSTGVVTIVASGKSEIALYGNPKITLKQFIDTAKLLKKEL